MINVIKKEIKKQKDKFARIREAYVNEVFTLGEYDLERKKGRKDYWRFRNKAKWIGSLWWIEIYSRRYSC